jgi:tetratricopeptide (TPR) repeat protein
LLLAIFLLALFIRTIHFLEFSRTPLSTVPVVDEGTYHDLAKGIARGEWIGEYVFWQAPLYPYFLGTLYIFNENIYFARVVQLIIGSFSCLLLYFITKMPFNRPVAFISSLILAIYPVMVWYEAQLLPPVLAIFLNLLAVFLLLRGVLFFSGIILGLSALTCQNVILFGLATFFWLLFRKRGFALLFLFGMLIPPLLITYRNWVVGGEAIFISSNSGINFFIGNNPDYDRSTQVRPGREWERLVGEPARVLCKRLTASEENRYWYHKAFSFIKEDPVGYIKLLIKKFFLFWQSYEIKRNIPYQPFKEDCSLLLKFLVIDFRIIGPLGILGMALLVSRYFLLRKKYKNLGFAKITYKVYFPMLLRRRYSIFYIFVISYTTSVILFFVTARYRLPVIPFLIPFAVSGAVATLSFFKKRRLRLVLLSFLALIFFLTGYKDFDKNKDKGDLYSLLGDAYKKRGEKIDAISAYKTALSFKPEDAETRCILSELYFEDGLLEEGVKNLEEGLSFSKDEMVLTMLGGVYRRMGKPKDAIIYLTEAIRVFPSYIIPYNEMAMAYLDLGELDKAEKIARFVVENIGYGKENPDAASILAEIYSKKGEDRLAREFQEKAMNLEGAKAR